MPITVNCRIILSSSDYNLTKEIHKAVEEVVKKRFGEKSIVLSSVNSQASQTGLFFAQIYLNLDAPTCKYYEVPKTEGG
jgi:hypothetical protein